MVRTETEYSEEVIRLALVLTALAAGPDRKTCDGTVPGRQNEEHWVFSCDAAVDAYAIGDDVYILPTHICTTVALYSQAVTVGRNGEVTGSWPISARDRLF